MPDFPIVDAHVHLYDPGVIRYGWMRGKPVLDRPRLMAQLDDERGTCEIEALVWIEVAVDPGQYLQEAAYRRRTRARRPAHPGAGGPCAARARRRGQAGSGEARGARPRPRHPPPGPGRGGRGVLPAPRLRRGRAPARGLRSELRHLRVPPSARQRGRAGAALPGRALRARPLRQARHPGQADGTMAHAHHGAGRRCRMSGARSPA